MTDFNTKESKVVGVRNCPVPLKIYDCDLLTGIEPSRTVRDLKIEADGDSWKGLIKPKIRLMGCWLERAGFKPGNRVQVICVAPGVIELRSTNFFATDDTGPSS